MSPRSETGVRRSRVRSNPALMGRRQIRGTARGFEPPSGLAEARLDAAPNKAGDWRSQAQFESRPDGSAANTGHGARGFGPPSGLPKACLDGTPTQTGVRRSRTRSNPALMGRRQIRGTERGFEPPSGLPKACLDGTPTQTGTRRSRVRSNPALVSRRQMRSTAERIRTSPWPTQGHPPYWAVHPPSMGTAVPVICPAASEQRNTAS